MYLTYTIFLNIFQWIYTFSNWEIPQTHHLVTKSNLKWMMSSFYTCSISPDMAPLEKKINYLLPIYSLYNEENGIDNFTWVGEGGRNSQLLLVHDMYNNLLERISIDFLPSVG